MLGSNSLPNTSPNTHYFSKDTSVATFRKGTLINTLNAQHGFEMATAALYLTSETINYLITKTK